MIGRDGFALRFLCAAWRAAVAALSVNVGKKEKEVCLVVVLARVEANRV